MQAIEDRKFKKIQQFFYESFSQTEIEEFFANLQKTQIICKLGNAKTLEEFLEIKAYFNVLEACKTRILSFIKQHKKE